MIDTNESLLMRVRSVEAHDAWQEFYKSYWSAIIRYARKLGLNEHQAKEILQDTMLALMRQLPAFIYDSRKGKFRNFLLTIVHRKSLALLRRNRRAADVSMNSGKEWSECAPAGVLPEENGVELEAERRWKETLMEEAIEGLASDPGLEEETVAVFRAYAIDGLGAADVARKFGIKENAVYQIKNRVTRRLQAIVARRILDSGGQA